MTRTRINIIGATGRLGHKVVTTLLERGTRPDDVLLSVRDPARARELGLGHLEVRKADYDDPASLREAFRDTDVLLLIPTWKPVDARLRQHASALDAARDRGIGRVVFSSFQACGSRSRFCRARFYHRAESDLRASATRWTIARSAIYLESIIGHSARQIRAGILSVPVVSGKAAFIGRDDVARGLAGACVGAGHDGQVYELTGRKALSMSEMADAISDATDRAIRFSAIPMEEYTARLADRGVPADGIEVWRTLWEAVEAGELERVTDSMQRLTGEAPSSTIAYIRRLLRSATTPGER